MINNFDAVSRFISFPNEDEFYFIQINKQKFKEKYPEVDIHTNNPSILYVP